MTPFESQDDGGGDRRGSNLSGHEKRRTSRPKVLPMANKLPRRKTLVSTVPNSPDGPLSSAHHRPVTDLTFTWIDILATLFSIGSFLFDIGTDIVVASFHYVRGDYWYFGLTTAFIIIPTLVMTGISMRWYVLDSRIEGAPSVSPLKVPSTY